MDHTTDTMRAKPYRFRCHLCLPRRTHVYPASRAVRYRWIRRLWLIRPRSQSKRSMPAPAPPANAGPAPAPNAPPPPPAAAACCAPTTAAFPLIALRTL